MQQHGVVATAEGISCSVFMHSPSLHPENVFAGLLKRAIAGDGADALPAGDALGIVPGRRQGDPQSVQTLLTGEGDDPLATLMAER